VSLYQSVADDLREAILSGRFAPGDRLPAEADLCTEYGVSRSTVREALRVLASQNLVATARGVSGGTFVALPKASEIRSYLENSFGMLTVHDEVPVDALLEARDVLEVPAAGLAAQRADAAAIAGLRATIVDVETTDFDRIQECNHLFHALLVEAAGNPLLEVVTRPVFSVLVSRSVHEPVVGNAYWSIVVEDHRLILEAVEAGDAEEARSRMRAHLDRLRATYASGLALGPA